jgi:uncharacterized protein (DUF885 family)
MCRTLLLLFTLVACHPQQLKKTSASKEDAALQVVLDDYVLGFLARNPVVNTYLGGAGYSASLLDIDGELRDYSVDALRKEDEWLKKIEGELLALKEEKLSSNPRIDRAVALAQLRYQLHLHQVRRYQERSLDSYTEEPFRGIDWQLQGMTQTGKDSYGTQREWELVLARVARVPAYLKVAQAQLSLGVSSGNTPDARVLFTHGLQATESSAKYFESTLPALFSARYSGDKREALLQQLQRVTTEAAASYRSFRDFVAITFFDDITSSRGVKSQFSADRFAMGEAEYNWALKNNLRLEKNAATLYEESWPVIQETRSQIITLSRQIGAARKLTMPTDDNQMVRFIRETIENTEPAPKDDTQMFEWYREASLRLVEYGKKADLFDVPNDYKLDVMETPLPLREGGAGASYYPAPPFKNTGVGRFYLTPTDNDPEALKDNNRSTIPDLSAHEGFPGHDWHYKVITMHRAEISPVRWLTPGAVEDSSSMWEDSMAAEGWGLYAEELIGEPAKGFPEGFYTKEERLAQLRGKFWRDLRVRLDIGLHTGRLSYDEAVDLLSETASFLPGSCRDSKALEDPNKKQSCAGAERSIFRYSKWPTQAITYRLGRDEIVSLRQEAQRKLGDAFSLKQFHSLFMRQGTIPAGYFRQELLSQLDAIKGK